MKRTGILFILLTSYILSVYSQLSDIELVKVKKGSFLMGDTCCNNNRQPIRQVTVNDFSIAKHEVTIRQFSFFVEYSQYVTDAEKGQGSTILIGEEWIQSDTVNWRHDTKGKRYAQEDDLNRPVIHVSWNDAAAYCKWLSEISGWKFRLPTEAEWEYAARGGHKNNSPELFSGSNNIDEVAWYLDNTNVDKGTETVGTKKANQLGVYDMTGNVWEWCLDWYDSKYSTNDCINPKGPTEGKRRVNRGGSWRTPAQPQSHITHRSSLAPEKQGNLLGFRIVCDDCK